MARILIFDIEATDLKADWGRVLCIGWKWLGAKQVHVIGSRHPKHASPRQLLDDSNIIRRFARVYERADIAITYYGSRYDQPYLQAKMVRERMSPFPPIPHLDLYFTVRRCFALSRRRLGNVADYFRLRVRKTPIVAETWQLAEMGDRRAQHYVEQHCRADVLVLEELYPLVRSYIRQHPWVAGRAREVCRHCGRDHVVRWGYVPTAAGMVRRVYCRDCHAWDRRPLQEIKKHDTRKPTTHRRRPGRPGRRLCGLRRTS